MAEKNKKPDRRTAYTRSVIKESMLALLAGRDFPELTVADVCRSAEISRSTFYRHYDNLRQVIDELFADAREKITRPDHLSGAAEAEANRHLCVFLRKNRKYLPLFLSPHFRGEAVSWFISSAPELREWLNSEGASLETDELRRIMFFQLNGCLALVQENLDVSDEEWAQIKNCIDAFVRRGMAIPAE